MKLAEENLSLETENIQQEYMFGISDMGMIFDILRNKMYSDRIGAICREITCNARDAHREVGKGDVPIKIILPSDLDPHWRVIDKGVGISPERMATIFIQYAASTKRDSNLQTGGFGLGAKTPFSYADSFMIETVFDGFKYLWNAVIDETKRGKILLMDKITTDDPNGTEIRIPVHEKDFREFSEKTEKATRWWDVAPEVVGYNYKNLRPSKDQAIMCGEGWEVHRSTDYYRDKLTVIVDGIQYDVDDSVQTLVNCSDAAQRRSVALVMNGRKHMALFFENGVLKMNANREQVSWDDDTKKKVVERIIEISDIVAERLANDIASCTTYKAACKRAKEFSAAFNAHGLLDGSDAICWNDLRIKTHFGSRYSEGAWIDYKVNDNAAKHGVLNVPGSVQRSKSSGYDVIDDMLIVVNDIGIQNLSVKRAVQIFDLLPEVSKFTVVPEKTWNSEDVFKAYQEHIPFLMLSKVTGTTEKKERKPRRTIWVWNCGKVERSSVDAWDNETRKRIFITARKAPYGNTTEPYLAGIRNVDEVLRYLTEKCDVRVFAFDKEMFDADPSSFEAFTDEAESALDYIKREIFAQMDLKTLYESSRIDGSSDHMRYKENLVEIAKEVKEPDVFQNYLEVHKKVQRCNDFFRVFSGLLRIVYAEDVQKWDDLKANKEVKAAYEAIVLRYPMLPLVFTHASHYGHSGTIADYCNMVDNYNKQINTVVTPALTSAVQMVEDW